MTCETAAPSEVRGSTFCRHRLNGYLVLHGNIPLRTAQSKHILKLLARERLGTSWAKHPFRRCRFWIARPSRVPLPPTTDQPAEPRCPL